MNFFVFFAMSAFLCVALTSRGLATRVAAVVPLRIAVLAVAWIFYLAARMVIVGSFDSAWLSYACAGSLLVVFCIAPVQIRAPAVVLRIWEISYIALVVLYAAQWYISGRNRTGLIYDPNTEGIILLLLSTPIWLRYASVIPTYLWALYAAVLAVTLSRSTGIMLLGFLLGIVFSRFSNRRQVIFPIIGVSALMVLVVMSLDPSMMPVADGPIRFLSLNDGSFYERRGLVLAVFVALTADLQSLLVGTSVADFALMNGNTVHNGFAEVFLACGVVGGALFIATYGFFVATYLSRKNFGIFIGYTFTSGFAVLLLNSNILLLFVCVFVLLDFSVETAETKRMAEI